MSRSLSHAIDSLRLKLKLFFGNYHLMVGKWRGVQFLGSCQFLGKPKFKLYRGTKVIVGNNCKFISGPTDNLIGVNRPCIISAHNEGTEIRIGENTGLSGTVIGAFAGITIGSNVKCGANTLITDSDWHPEDPRSGPPAPIFIGDNVWLGVNAIVLKGVSIGDNVVIGANSVVTKDIPAGTIAAGNPCKVIREL